MEIKEHFYADDPARGPADARTTLPGVSYFFLGNGLIQAAVQVTAAPGATPAGLLVMDPERLGPKRAALTFDPASGLAPTMITIAEGAFVHRPHGRSVRARWVPGSPVPTVELSWKSGPFCVREIFFCPDERSPRLLRSVEVTREGGAPRRRAGAPGLRTGAGGIGIELPIDFVVTPEALSSPRPVSAGTVPAPSPASPASSKITSAAAVSSGKENARTFPPGGRSTAVVLLEYRIVRRGAGMRSAESRVAAGSPAIEIRPVSRSTGLDPAAVSSWGDTAVCRISDRRLDRMFDAAKSGLRAVTARSGRLDGGVWQYNLEWVRDQAFAAMALTMSGQFAPARTILERLVRDFVGPEGATLDSSRARPWQESEFDQNGVLLFALESYANWTGDLDLVRGHWEKIARAADFPLRRAFRHPASGLLRNRREFWERHAAHGLREGMELAHQLFVSMGLRSASHLAARLGDGRRARRWLAASGRLRSAMLGHPQFSLVSGGRFVKRRDISGAVAREIRPPRDAGFPPGTPLFSPGRHFIDPDTSAALPVAWEFVDPAGPLARRTLASLEKLWNQRWTGGGYGRYHVTSEPDSPGPWPFASLFVARAYFEAGNDAKVRRVLDWLDGLPGGVAGTWFEFYGPRPVPPYPQVGVVPWVWAEVLFLFVHHMFGVRPGARGLVLRPRLLGGLDSMEGSFRLRDGRLEVSALRARKEEKPGYLVDGVFHPFTKHGIVIPFPGASQSLRIQAILP